MKGVDFDGVSILISALGTPLGLLLEGVGDGRMIGPRAITGASGTYAASNIPAKAAQPYLPVDRFILVICNRDSSWCFSLQQSFERLLARGVQPNQAVIS